MIVNETKANRMEDELDDDYEGLDNTFLLGSVLNIVDCLQESASSFLLRGRTALNGRAND